MVQENYARLPYGEREKINSKSVRVALPKDLNKMMKMSIGISIVLCAASMTSGLGPNADVRNMIQATLRGSGDVEVESDPIPVEMSDKYARINGSSVHYGLLGGNDNIAVRGIFADR